MPIHDWTRADAGLFHSFHQDWTIELCRTLNRGLLPPGFNALADQVTGPIEPDVVTLRNRKPNPHDTRPSGAIALLEAPPKARFIEETVNKERYSRKANVVKITHWTGEVVAVIEVVSPGNKSSQNGLDTFVRKAAALIRQGIHLLVIDLFPPTVRDPHGIHRAIWGYLTDSTFEPPADKPLTVAAYQAVLTTKAFIEPLAVGDELPEMPIFLTDEMYILAPLDSTYRTSWAAFPDDYKELVEPVATPQ